MTIRSQKRRDVAELVSGDFETPVNENIPSEDLIAGRSKILRIEPENLDEMKTSSGKEILSDLSKILAENQKVMLKLIVPLSRKRPTCINYQNSDSEPSDYEIVSSSRGILSQGICNVTDQFRSLTYAY